MAKKPMSLKAIRKHNDEMRAKEYAAKREAAAVMKAPQEVKAAMEADLLQRVKNIAPEVVSFHLIGVNRLNYVEGAYGMAEGYARPRRALLLWLEESHE